METRLVAGSTERLAETMHDLDADPSVRGLLVLAADDFSLSTAFDSVLRRLSTPVFGGVFPQVIYRGENRTDAAVVAGLAVEPKVTVVSELGSGGADFGTSLPTAVPRGGTAFVFADAYANRVEDFVESLFGAYGVTLNYVGGGAGSLDAAGEPCLITGDGILADAAVVATVDAPADVGVRHGWEEVTGPLRVTAADGRTIVELNGEDAFSVYRETVETDTGGDTSVTPEAFFEVASQYPFGIARLEGERIVRDPYELGDDGSITCFGNVPEGDFLHVLRGDVETLVAAAGEAYGAVDSGGAGVDGRDGARVRMALPLADRE